MVRKRYTTVILGVFQKLEDAATAVINDIWKHREYELGDPSRLAVQRHAPTNATIEVITKTDLYTELLKTQDVWTQKGNRYQIREFSVL